MENFSIKVIDPAIRKWEGDTFCFGQIQIGNFEERFEMLLGYWTIDDYKKQWKLGLERILNHNESCLVAEIQDPQKAPWLVTWVLYRDGNTIYIQNHTLVKKSDIKALKQKSFTFDNYYEYINPRGRSEEVSEWVTDLDSIKKFLAK